MLNTANDASVDYTRERGLVSVLSPRLLSPILRQQIFTWWAEGIDHQRILDRLGGVERLARDAQRLPGHQLARHICNREAQPPAQQVGDLLVRRLMLGQVAAGV